MTPRNSRMWPILRPWAAGLFVFACSWFAIVYTKNGAHIAPFWPGNAIALVWLLRAPGDRRAMWGAVTLALLAANLFGGVAPLSSILFTLCNLCDIGVSYLIMRWPQSPAEPGDPGAHRGRLIRIVCGALCGPAVGATLAAIVLAPVLHAQPGALWVGWSLPSMLAMLIITPIGLMVSMDDVRRLRDRRLTVEAVASLALLIAIPVLIIQAQRVGFIYLASPVLLFAGARFRVLGAAVAVALTALYAAPIAGGAFGAAILGTWSERGLILMIQGFLMVNAVTSLSLAAILDQRDALMNALKVREAAAMAQARAKSRLLMSVSHEIRTPLNVIQGLGEMLTASTPVNARQQTLIDSMLTAAGRLQALAHDLLDSARIEQGALRLAPESFSPTPLLRGLIQERERAHDGVTIHLDIQPAVEIWGDPLRFQQIAQNLLSNAVKHGARYGPITVGVRAGTDMARIEVIDRGPGFPVGASHLAFEPFAWAGRESVNEHSAGVGLSVVKMLAEAHGGRVGCRSTPHVETRVWADLPLRHAVSARRPEAEDAGAEPDPAMIFGERDA